MLPTAPFGSTGHDSTRVIFGAAALSAMSQERADATMEVVRRRGINHVDTAARYGESEVRLRPWLASHRDEVFLATKTGERTGADARRELERSLERMGVDTVDLIQLHNLVDEDEWATAFAPGGAVEALAAARDEGIVGHVGVTGHGLPVAAMHLRSLERFDFASVLFPVNFSLMQNDDYRADVAALSAACVERGVAMQTIKSIARRRWIDDDVRKFSWYEPITDVGAIGRAVRYVLAEESWFLNTSSDARLLEPVLDAAEGALEAPSDSEMRRDLETEAITPLFDEAHPVAI